MNIKQTATNLWTNRNAIAKKGLDGFMDNPTGWILATISTIIAFICGDIADSAERAANAAEVSALVDLDEHLGTDYISRG
tara:strand:+ start:485 stop:724 length:240 start_codon:yes stop_codon:yes gene_type:complete